MNTPQTSTSRSVRTAETTDLSERPERIGLMDDAAACAAPPWVCAFCNTQHPGGDPGMRPVQLLTVLAPTVPMSFQAEDDMEDDAAPLPPADTGFMNTSYHDPVAAMIANTGARYCGIQCFVLRTLVRHGAQSFVGQRMQRPPFSAFLPPAGDPRLVQIYAEQLQALQTAPNPFAVTPVPPRQVITAPFSLDTMEA